MYLKVGKELPVKQNHNQRQLHRKIETRCQCIIFRETGMRGRFDLTWNMEKEVKYSGRYMDMISQKEGLSGKET